jgi:hypothetical protein
MTHLNKPRKSLVLFTNEEMRRMFDMFKNGEKLDAIAATMPTRSVSTVRRKMTRMGLTRMLKD